MTTGSMAGALADGTPVANVVVRFETGTQVQWATGKLTPETADPVMVATGGTTVVDDVLLP